MKKGVFIFILIVILVILFIFKGIFNRQTTPIQPVQQVQQEENKPNALEYMAPGYSKTNEKLKELQKLKDLSEKQNQTDVEGIE